MRKENKNNFNSIPKKLAILAGKGGVGKSTITALLAKGMLKKNYKVGVLDADLYGPSMRHLFPDELLPQAEGEKVRPAMSGGIAVMSSAYFPENQGVTVVRAPIANQVVTQFVEEVDWGELDLLLVDFPPGTGDIQISLLQKIAFDAALILTLPHELSAIDVRKSVLMCEQMGVPLLGILENMSYLSDPQTGKPLTVFGEGGGANLAKEFHLPFLGKIPIEPSLNCQEGLSSIPTSFSSAFQKVFEGLKKEKTCIINHEDRYHFSIEWLDGKKSFYRFSVLQKHCPCALCQEGKGSQDVKDVEGNKVVLVGRYGIQVAFSSGCSKGIYPFSLLREFDR
ncbi:MAG: P-loop NTPase [Chlamydiia bacterium]|nr:P-loop NTPase [Chlamydiia bacterium]